MKMLATLLLCLTAGFALAQEKKAYVIFDAKGLPTDYGQMMQTLATQDVVFIGEIHNCPIAHWMEQEIIRDLHALHGSKLMLGAEMFERDNQLILDEYLGGIISAERFKAEARLWPNYKTDYAPVVEFAREKGLRFVATNIPRRYANVVSRGGLGALGQLTDQARQWIAPLPLNYVRNEGVAAYFGTMTMPGMKATDTENLIQAQAAKDATMAWSIAGNIRSHFVHLNGSFHSAGHDGIITYLNQYRPGLKIAAVEVVRQDTVDRLDPTAAHGADFYICVPKEMTTTY